MSRSHKLKIYIRIAFHFLTIIAGMAVIVFLFVYMQSNASKTRQTNNSNTLLDEMFATLDDNEKTVKMLTDHYNELNSSAVSSMTGVLTYDKLTTIMKMESTDRDEAFKELYNAISAEILMVVDKNGKVVLSCGKDMNGQNISSDTILGRKSYNELINDGYTRTPSKDSTGRSYYLFSSSIKDDDSKKQYRLVTWNDCDVLEKEIASLDDVDRIIGGVKAGTSGFVFVVDGETDKFSYFVNGDNEYTGKSINESGLSTDSLKDGYSGIQTIFGIDYFCTTKVRSSSVYGENALFVIAVPMSDMNAGMPAAIWSAFIFLTFALLMLSYSLILGHDLILRNKTTEHKHLISILNKEYYYSDCIGKKILPVFLTGIIVIGLVSMYTQTMNAISRVRSQSYTQMEEAKKNLKLNKGATSAISKYYDKQFESKALMISFLLEEQPEKLYYGDYGEDDIHSVTKENKDGTIEYVKDENDNQEYSIANSPILQKMCKEFAIDEILVFNDDGHTVAANDDLRYFALSTNKKDQSYPFRNVLEAKERTYVQEAQENEQGVLSQYIGCRYNYYTYVDADGNTCYTSKEDYDAQNKPAGNKNENGKNQIKKHDSLIQICVLPERLDDVKKSTEVAHVLAGMPVAGGGSMYAFKDDDDHTVIYSPNSREIGKPASVAGLKNSAFTGEYCGFRRTGGQQIFDDVRLIDGIYVSSSIPVGSMYKERNKITFWTIIISAVFMFALFLMLAVSSDDLEKMFSELINESENNRKKRSEKGKTKKYNSGSQIITVEMMSGRKKRIKAVEARWGNDIVPWESMSPEQKFGTVVKIYLGIFVVYLFIMVIRAKSNADAGFLIPYIMSGDWDRGANIFAFSACVMTMLTIVVVTWFIKFVLDRITFSMGTRAETIGHITESIVRYGSIIGGLFYCLYMLGLNAASLLTSAGIMSVVVGLGAQSLISDLLAGLSIVFEGAFRVGDIVTIGDFRGQVLEIGLRTTKIEDASGNIKIFNNSSINSIINMTRRHSYAVCDVNVDYGEDIEHIEAVLNEEFPGIKSRLSSIEEGPFYKGVATLGDSGVSIRIVAKCSEKNRIQLSRDLNREVYIIFMKHKINIPYPQMEVSFRKDSPDPETSTVQEEKQAEQFVKKQRKAAERNDDDE